MSKPLPRRIPKAFLTPKRDTVALTGDMTCIHLTVQNTIIFLSVLLVKPLLLLFTFLCVHTNI